jgi:hypothetical protein
VLEVDDYYHHSHDESAAHSGRSCRQRVPRPCWRSYRQFRRLSSGSDDWGQINVPVLALFTRKEGEPELRVIEGGDAA